MAEIKTGIFAKNVQKRLNRAQEKVLQKLGKADETKDEQFEQVVINFRRQESEGSRLQREMKAYMAAIKAMQQASINLTESLHEVYEPDWHGKDDVMIIGKDCDALWEDFHNKLVDSTLLNLDAYLQQFPDLKNRVAKRSRKLIDFDSARHHVETLQASGIRNDRKVIKAEEELKKAQKVFDELNVGLQDELPTLWDSRVGFYISTFKNVTSLEAKFHREIFLLCKQLYEVMTKLGEQHSDKMFTIQGAPSDSGPLRLARTPSPPDDETPPESPDAGSNHMLRPVSPGPPRPKSPSQLKKGPPVPPPPKVTPTKEVAQEQIIDLFGGEFLPAPSPSQPNERPGESLLDLDFDAFQPDESVSPIPQTALPWDMWSGNAQPAQPATDAGFIADWSADFGSAGANGDRASATSEALTVGQDETQGSPPEGGWAGQTGEATTVPQPQESEATTTAGDETTSAFNGFSQDAAAPSFFADFDKMNEVSTAAEAAESTPRDLEMKAAPQAMAEPREVPEEPTVPPAGEAASSEITPSPKEEKPASTVGSPVEFAATEEMALAETQPAEETRTPPSEATPLEIQSTPEEKGSPVNEALEIQSTPEEKGSPVNEALEIQSTPEEKGSPVNEALEKMSIPSVVIEPASSNEGDDDHDGDIISPATISDNGVLPESQVAKDITSSDGVQGLPDGYMYKVETMHDFEAANSDELELKRGDVVLVVPTALAEDQDAGWLTGIKESDWLTLGTSAQRGLFPENFTQRLE
ncbi:amphiphysin [Lampris incognitus]|uniref:amphiphysin n=1 Tax=Lampris incognitus TaxID=2546036 RepID=UPI0024B4E15B|nr:amphiphysin [Lampris incognitus]